jgi:hypothetical protein
MPAASQIASSPPMVPHMPGTKNAHNTLLNSDLAIVIYQFGTMPVDG